MSLSELSTDYAGRKPELFKLSLKTSFLTIITLGFYRFWMKTRMRRFYWSAIRPGGQPLEYVGLATEKLLGFLTAVAFLAFYIGIVNLILMFLSFSVFNGTQPAYLVSFVGLVPVIFFAQYRARRYILARTRWRGIRFGLEPGVSGFVWRSMLHWGLTVLTLGLYWPIKTYHLEKYRTDRTWYGDQKLEQGGRWTMLLGPMRHVYLPGLVIALIVGVSAGLDRPEYLSVLVLPVGWLLFGLAYWKAHSFKRLTEAKRLGEVRLKTQPSVGRIIGIYAGGYALMNAVVMLWVLGMLMVGFLFVAMIMATFGGGGENTFGELANPENWISPDGEFGLGIARWIIALGTTVVYFAVFLFYRTLTEVFVTLPMARHFAEVTTIDGAPLLDTIGQRARDEFAEAEGFADALPLGEGM